MSKLFILSLLCLLTFPFLFSHEGHKEIAKQKTTQTSIHPTQGEQPTVKQFGGRPQNWMQWIGGFHFIFLHFPIALIVMTAISELLFAWYQKPIFDYASRFMLIVAAILAPPTALFGFIYSYTASYEGLLANFVWWHMWFGITTAVFVVVVAFLRERKGTNKFYYACLFLLFLLVNITGMLGGGMTFGPYHMLPPIYTHHILIPVQSENLGNAKALAIQRSKIGSYEYVNPFLIVEARSFVTAETSHFEQG